MILLRGAQIFQTMLNSFQQCPKDFSRGEERFAGGGFAPLSLGYGPVSNSFKVSQTHISRGAENLSS